MGDMAPRPRGGWQVGTRLFKQQRDADADRTAEDPAPDVYQVIRADGRFIVKHFPTADATTPCCVVCVTPKPGESDIAALARAGRHCDRKHEEQTHGK